MSNQTSVSLRMGKGYPGQIADIYAGNKIISMTTEEETLDFGVIVSRNSKGPAELCQPGGDARDPILGITVREVSREARSIGEEVLCYRAGEAVGIMQEGYIYATCVAGCTAGDIPLFIAGTGALSAGEAGEGEISLDGWEWMDTVTANGVAKLRVNGTTARDLTAGSGA